MRDYLITVILAPFVWCAWAGWKLGRALAINRQSESWARDQRSFEAFWADEFAR